MYVNCVLPTVTKCFGEPVIIKPCRGGTFEIMGVYDERFQQIDPDTEEVIASNVPVVGIRLADIPFAPEQGDKVKVDGRWYRVTDSQEDGLGHSNLFLHREG